MSAHIVRCRESTVDDAVKVDDEGLGQTLWTAMRKHSSNAAFVESWSDVTITYGDLMNKAELVARRLLSLACKRGDVIVLIAPNSINWVAVWLAAVRIASVPAAIQPSIKQEELKHLLEKCSPKYIYTTYDLLSLTQAAASGIGTKFVLMEEERRLDGCVDIGGPLGPDESLPQLPEYASLDVKLDEMCMMDFSSGTIGLPKPVMMSHRGLQHQLVIERQRWHFIGDQRRGSTDDVVVGKTVVIVKTLAHVMITLHATFAMVSGFTGHLLNSADWQQLLRIVDEQQVQMVTVNPYVTRILVNNPVWKKFRLRCLKYIVSTGSPSDVEVETQLMKEFPGVEVRHSYGMTEAGHITSQLQRQVKTKPGSVGSPEFGISMKVIDLQTGESLGANISGEICIKSPSVMLGYYNDSEATATDIDAQGWLHSGDVGYYDEDGDFYLVDRIKDVIKGDTNKVFPAVLDALLLSHPDVEDAAVFGIPDPVHLELPCAWVVRKPSTSVTERQLQQFVNAQVAPYEELRGGIRFVSAIPRTTSGKILRRQMRDTHLR